MCVSCLRMYIQEQLDMDAAVIASGGSPVRALVVVEHEGHCHIRTVCEDGTRGLWDACGGSLPDLRLLCRSFPFSLCTWPIEAYPSMPEADERGLEAAVLVELEACALLGWPDVHEDSDKICAICHDEFCEISTESLADPSDTFPSAPASATTPSSMPATDPALQLHVDAGTDELERFGKSTFRERMLSRIRRVADGIARRMLRNGTGCSDPDNATDRITTTDSAASQPTGTWVLPCGHAFHALCVRPWFDRHITCPTCRDEVLLPAVATKRQEYLRLLQADQHPQCKLLSDAFLHWAKQRRQRQ